ncbi:MAG: hypothetical protein V7765_00960 [Oleispira sp.]
MNKNLKKSSIINVSISIPLLLLVNSIAWAEISSLSSEELTDTYIKDTTVIVRQQKPENKSPSVPVKLKVTPIEEATQLLPQDQTHSVSSISYELSTYDDLNNLRALDNNLAPQLPLATTEFLKAPISEGTLDKIRAAYSLTGPIDLTSLDFKASLPDDLDISSSLPTNSNFSADGNSFTIKIPNLGNFNSQQIASPNGEIGVNVTPSHIEYTLNLPK